MPPVPQTFRVLSICTRGR